MERIDLVGRKFERLTVIEYLYTKNRRPYYKVRCDCGNEKIVAGSSLTRGLTRSCGCLRNERVIASISRHNLSSHPLYNIYCSMKTRCYNTSSYAYKHYGARGITMCDEWKNDFLSFYEWSIKNGWEDRVAFGYKNRVWTLDRIDVNKGYSPDNCRYVSAFMQANNTRRNKTDRVSYLDRNHGVKK